MTALREAAHAALDEMIEAKLAFLHGFQERDLKRLHRATDDFTVALRRALEEEETEAVPTRRLIRNAARCLSCGDTLESKHRHDFRTCQCGRLSVDGGLDYARRLIDGPYEELSEMEEETAEGATKVAALADAMRRK